MGNGTKYPAGVRPSHNHSCIQIRWQYKGRPFVEYIPEKPTEANLAKAVKFRAQRIKAMKMAHVYGIVEGNTTEPDAPLKLFADVAQEYLDHTNLAPSTYNHYKNALNKYWMPQLGNVPMQVIDHKIINRILHNITGITWKTRMNILIPLKQVFKFAFLEREYVESNPTDRIRVKRGQKEEADPFTLEEMNTILSKLTGDELLYFAIAFEAGLRAPSEILALEKTDFDGKTLSVSKGRVEGHLKKTTKTTKARKVLVTKRLRKLLMEAKMKSTSNDMFVLTCGRPVRDADELNKRWKVVLEEAGIRYRRAYNCRHTYASLGLMAGAKPAFLAGQLGHSLEMFYNTYARWINTEADIGELSLIEKFKS